MALPKIDLPIAKNIIIPIGADFAFRVVFKQGGVPLDLTGWSFWAELWNDTKIDDFNIDVHNYCVVVSLHHSQTINYPIEKKAKWSLRFQTPNGLIKDLFVGYASIVNYPTLPSP